MMDSQRLGIWRIGRDERVAADGTLGTSKCAKTVPRAIEAF